jgi:hypothetical protein
MDFQNVDFLKSIKCKYHIFGFDDSVIKGMITFNTPITEYRLQNIFQNKNIILLNAKFNISDYRSMNHYWEKGEGEIKVEDNVTNPLLKQNNLLLEMQKDLCDHLIRQNQYLMEQIQTLTEQNHSLVEKNLQKAAVNMTTNNHIENNNKTFNINVFLNEDCKNAITLGEFVKQIVIQDDDLFYAKDNGLAEAITNVFKRELQNYDLRTRPFHCTDMKRETMHIKADDGWIKEAGDESRHMNQAIHNISFKKMKKMKQYFDEHPYYKHVENPDYNDSVQMMRQIMGLDESPDKTKKQVLRNISKNVFLEK